MDPPAYQLASNSQNVTAEASISPQPPPPPPPLLPPAPLEISNAPSTTLNPSASTSAIPEDEEKEEAISHDEFTDEVYLNSFLCKVKIY